VAEAEAEFAELQRELSGVSEKSRRESAHYVAKKGDATDVEKAAVPESISEDSQFDLESTLRGGKAADEEAGIKPKHIGVIWEGLTVTGFGGVTNFVKIFPDAFISFFNVFETAMSVLGVGKKGHDVNILTDFRGVTKPGEMVLVLGRPGSGCTTFLKVIANQRFGYSSVTGDVMYGPFNAEAFAKRYRGEATYNQVCSS
jgi:ABC-type ATPase with predicted acetyltransferase domain